MNIYSSYLCGIKGASLDWCKCPDRGLPCPDVIFYFHLSSEEALKRSGYGEERYEKKSFQEVSQ
uniref:Thymidylate kinase-like domain-containing protein n=1 Tax=Amphimedon queenslandica TaxID=400682 RepID=A0A1X7UW07_AMPQE